jgi:hypothetical protein
MWVHLSTHVGIPSTHVRTPSTHVGTPSGEQLPYQIADGTGLSIVLRLSILSSYPARV